MNWGRYMITIENLNYRHKNCNKSNLENLYVDFKPGIVNVIIGKNGSGKTTLFDYKCYPKTRRNQRCT